MGEIEFKGELHTIPAGAALVLKVDRAITPKQAADIKEQAERALGAGHRVLVIGPELTALATGGLVPSHLVTVGMASGPDMTCIAVPHTGEWSEVATITGDVGVTSRRIPLQRLQVKDTMSQAMPGGAGYSFRVHECAGGGAAPGTGGGPAHGTNGKALELMGVTSPGLGTATMAPTCGAETAKFLADKLAGGPRAVTLLPEEADEDGHPKAMPANANLLKVR